MTTLDIQRSGRYGRDIVTLCSFHDRQGMTHLSNYWRLAKAGGWAKARPPTGLALQRCIELEDRVKATGDAFRSCAVPGPFLVRSWFVPRLSLLCAVLSLPSPADRACNLPPHIPFLHIVHKRLVLRKLKRISRSWFNCPFNLGNSRRIIGIRR